jgi:pyrroline-5-carboxylate reductase
MTSSPTTVGGRYELGELLGRGGMAEVRRAVDQRLGRSVAVKQLRTDLAIDPTFQARFRREAQSAAGLNHPTIVAVYDTGEEIDPLSGVAIPYIVMELVEGSTLRDVLREGRKILPERALELTQGVLEALSYSHKAGIVHRDIKPANVMLTPNGGVKVMDFGIARAVADTSATMTQTAAVIGAAQYLSPEQARGETVDARSDLYSTGCLLYELLVGRPPFVGDSPVSVAYQHVREAPVPPSQLDPEITPEIDAVVLKALAKDPADRYQSALEMKAHPLAILGAGVMGETVLSGLLRAGWHADQIVATDRRLERQLELTTRYGIKMLENTEAVAEAETVILVVKPQDMNDLLSEISQSIKPGALVVSLAAGVDTAFIESRLPEGVAVVRVMPNTPAQVDEGMAAISPGSHSNQDHLDRVTEILSATGRVITVPERYQDAVTAISGTGPAYLFFVVEAMIEAGVHLGLPRDTATELVVQTMLGSAKLLRETGEHPTVLRERVTSPGGTTAAAVRELEDHKVRAAFLRAMEAARDRSRDLAAAAREDQQGTGRG